MPDLSGNRGDDLGAIAAFAANAGARALAPLGYALREEGGTARRARLQDRARPRHELAVGVLAAGVERLAPAAPALQPIRGGNAPGTAPTSVAKGVTGFRGVYMSR